MGNLIKCPGTTRTIRTPNNSSNPPERTTGSDRWPRTVLGWATTHYGKCRRQIVGTSHRPQDLPIKDKEKGRKRTVGLPAERVDAKTDRDGGVVDVLWRDEVVVRPRLWVVQGFSDYETVQRQLDFGSQGTLFPKFPTTLSYRFSSFTTRG